MEQDKQRRLGRLQMLGVLAVCAAPLILSYFMYYVVKPESRANYGALIDPRAHPIPELDAVALDGQPASIDDYKGKWIMLQADSGACLDPCQEKLLKMRQLRLMQGKHMDRIERVWLVTDAEPVETMVLRQYDGTRLLRVNPEVLKSWLPTEGDTNVSDHIYMIDPLGNLMMRFPKDGDPSRMKKDIGRLLKASSIG